MPLKPLKIALTGGIACGKSQFAKFLRELGVQTLDADDIVHEIIPEEERRRLAKIVFKDPAARRELEARIHPLVRERINAWFASQPPQTLKPSNPQTKVAIIPLLFECNWGGDYDIILCISSPVAEQMRRMVEMRALSRIEAEARLNAQLPQEEKIARSHYVIDNDSTLEHLHQEAVRCVAWLRSQQH